MIPYGRQDITEDDIEAVAAVLRSDFLTQGPMVPRFEQAVAGYCSVAHAVAVNSATSALHLACLALGAGPGERVWTSPVTFVASANCALYCGADVDFVDIDPDTWNMSVTALARKLAEARNCDQLPRVVIPVHLGGQPCDMKAIRALSREYGFAVIEDASHAIGGRYCDEPVGNCRHSDITVFSFHPVKIITTGEGGMVTTNDPVLARRVARLRTHGITRDTAEMTQAADGPWYYQQVELGFNYRMTDIQAGLGLSQFERVDQYVSRRHHLAARYDQMLAGLPVASAKQIPESYSALHLYVIRLQLDHMTRSHRHVFEGLREAGIGVNLHYIPVYRQPYYADMGFVPSDYPNAERYYAEAISIPLHPRLSESDQESVVAAISRECER